MTAPRRFHMWQYGMCITYTLRFKQIENLYHRGAAMDRAQGIQRGV